MAAIREIEQDQLARRNLSVVPPPDETPQLFEFRGRRAAASKDMVELEERRNNFGMRAFERQLVDQAVAGDVDSFGEIYILYQSRIQNYVYHRTGNIHDAEDIASKVFLQAFTHIGCYKPRAPFSFWLFRIAHNQVVNHLRYMQKHHLLPLLDFAVLENPREEFQFDLESLDLSVALRSAIMSLPEDGRRALVLHCYYGLPFKEIGPLMDRSTGAAKALVFRARKRIKEFWTEQNDEL